MKDAIDSISKYPKSGAQCTYPGDLIENINSLANANQLGYSKGWNKTYSDLFKETNSGGNPRLDNVLFTYHHAFGPLISRKMLLREIQLQQLIEDETWGKSKPKSKGFFPTEMAFSERMIPALLDAGIEWVIIPNSHISRCVSNYSFSQQRDTNDPPNKIDQINPPSKNWLSLKVDRGCEPLNAVPMAFRPHYAQYIDPETGSSKKIIVVPSAMAMSWKDSESCYGTGDIDQIAQFGNDKPLLIVLAHDGDNFFAGGYTYYTQCVSQFTNEAASKGYTPTTIQQFLNDYPVDSNDIVHVSDGAWINHDHDDGDPQFIFGWNGVPFNTTGDFDLANGWECNQFQWAVITASQNWVEFAEQDNPIRINQVYKPDNDATNAEIAWHFFLVQPSGWLYYGCPMQDMQDKPILSANQAIEWAKKSPPSTDKTPPTIWYVQRYPYNPGELSDLFKNWQRTLKVMPTDFWIWTFAYDTSGIKTTQLKYQIISSKVPIYSDSTWKSLNMIKRPYPKSHNGIKFDFIPSEIADEYYVKLTGIKNSKVAYYIESTDNFGNIAKSDIYSVYIGGGN